MSVLEPVNVSRCVRDQEKNCGLRSGNAKYSAGHRVCEALDDQLPNEPQAACAEGRANRNFAAARHDRADLKTGDVGACRGEHDHHHRGEQLQWVHGIADQQVLERPHQRTASTILVGMSPLE
jgi:hypothetical protein